MPPPQSRIPLKLRLALPRGCDVVADAAFICADHNLLEPPAFGKPTFVCDGWAPGHPVYREVLDAGALAGVASPDPSPAVSPP